jgi:hypothetical protein
MWSRLHDDPITNDGASHHIAASSSASTPSSANGAGVELQSLTDQKRHDDNENDNNDVPSSSIITVAPISAATSGSSGNGGIVADDDNARLLPVAHDGGIAHMRIVSPSSGMTSKRYGMIMALLVTMCIIAVILSTRDRSDLVIYLPRMLLPLPSHCHTTKRLID